MRKPLIYLLSATSILLGGCYTESYFQSPLQGNATSYKAIPRQADSLSSATYINGTIFGGGANELINDNFCGFTGTIHRAHNFGMFQGFYGITGSAGIYQTDDRKDRKVRDQYIRTIIPFKNHFFGSLGATSGINIVMPFKNGEWRAVGVEGSWQKEFGNYYQFRRSLPDSNAVFIERRNYYATWGISSEVLGKVSKHITLGYKAAYIASFRPIESTAHDGEYLYPAYFCQTIHLATDRFNANAQLNIGTYVFGMQLGFGYRIGR